MKNLIFALFTIITFTFYSQIIQNVNKNTGTYPKAINIIDSIRFNTVTNQMEILHSNGNLQSHTISDIINVTFSGYWIGTVTNLDCAGAIFSGTLTSGILANGASITINYTGGNAGTYGNQNIPSTGVTGLNAILTADTLNNGIGSITYTINGIPNTVGAASFAINFGGQLCVISIPVTPPPAAVATLNCAGATQIGTLTCDSAAAGVNVTIPYFVGNAGSYNGQSINSTGVTGLTATLLPGTLANGNGSVTYTITGTPSFNGIANFNLTLGGQSCNLMLTVNPPQPQFSANSIFCTQIPTSIIEVMNPVSGKIWMDRNLGASQVATSSTDQNAYGDLYQWGRMADGHQCRTSSTTSNLSSVDQPSHGDFIVTSNAPNDWRSPQNINLWQGINGINNPCPSGFRLPTSIELNGERLTWGNQQNNWGAFLSPLKLTVTGFRNFDGTLIGVGSDGYYWSSTLEGASNSRGLFFGNNNATISFSSRAVGGSIRCIKETLGFVSSLDCNNISQNGFLISGQQASNVTVTIPYTGGNGGTFSWGTCSSTGVIGLTAYTIPDTLNYCCGSVTYTITGTPTSSGVANFNIILGGQSCSFSLNVVTIESQYPGNSVFCVAGPTAIVDVTNPLTGQTWMDRNLGASQVAATPYDQNAYGDLYQWGRRTDGHQCRTSPVTNLLSSVDQPPNGVFILSPNNPRDWRNPQNLNLWQGVNGVNNPCPTGYRVPTITELNNESLTWVGVDGEFNSVLKWVGSSTRNYSNGGLGVFPSTAGGYWSSTIVNGGSTSQSLNLGGVGSGFLTNDYRASGLSVRCIKN